MVEEKVYLTNHPSYATLPIGRLKACEWRGLEKAIRSLQDSRTSPKSSGKQANR